MLISLSVMEKEANLYFESKKAEGYTIWERRLPEYIDVTRYILNLDSKPTNELRILEIGCAGGGFLHYSEKKLQVKEAVGVDLSKMLLASAAKSGSKVMLGSALQLPIRDESFDCVVAVSLLHHLVGTTTKASLDNDLRALREMGRVTRRDGRIIVKEDIAVRGEATRKMIFMVTKTLAKKAVGVGFLKIYPGEVLAFLSPASFEWLTLQMQKWGFRRLAFYSYFREGTGLPKVLIPLWERITCKLLACYLKLC